jgi:hypothetical protein
MINDTESAAAEEMSVFRSRLPKSSGTITYFLTLKRSNINQKDTFKNVQNALSANEMVSRKQV